MRITLYLMTQKGFEVLNALIVKNLQSIISEVILGRDKNIQNDYAAEIISLCKQNNIKHFERHENHEVLSDYSLAISWRWLIPESNSKLIVLHDSLLPKYRGFSPLVNMLINKEKEIGVSALFASEEYDKGDIIAQSSTIINYPITISEAINLISENYIALTLKIFSLLISNKEILGIPQNELNASYSLWRNEEDYLINWQKSSEEILNLINAVSNPYKGATTFLNGLQKVRILEAELITDVTIENRDVGKLIFVKNNFPVIVCGSGLIKILKIIDDKTGIDMLPFNSFRICLTAQSNF